MDDRPSTGALNAALAVAANGHAQPTRLTAYACRDGRVEPLADAEAVRQAATETGASLWVDLDHDGGPEVAALAGSLGLHPLIVEDILERNQRAKIELTDGLLYLVMFALLPSPEGGTRSVEIDLVLGSRFLLSAHGRDWDPGSTHHLRAGVDAYLRGGPDYVLWALVDALVDGYFPVFDAVGDEIDDLEDDVMRAPSRAVVERLFRVKRQLTTIRRAINPEREIFNQLTNRDLGLVAQERILYFRDVYDHLIRLTDELDAYRDMVGTTLDVYLTTVNNNLSEVMKRLTAVTVVLAGVGALAGLFGMSEAPAALAGREGGGFWVVVVFALVLGAVATWAFRRAGWL